MKKTLVVAILTISVLGILAMSAVIVYAAVNGAPKCQTIAGCANVSGLRETLKAMPTYTPGPSPTMVPCHWEGSFCIPGIAAPEKPQAPGHLRPWHVGYPYDVEA